MTITKTRVWLDGECALDAVDRGERWNGFVVPYLTADAIATWAEWANEDGEWDGAQVEVAHGVLTIWEDGTERAVTAEDDGTFRFDLGLIWTPAETEV